MHRFLLCLQTSRFEHNPCHPDPTPISPPTPHPTPTPMIPPVCADERMVCAQMMAKLCVQMIFLCARRAAVFCARAQMNAKCVRR